MWLGDTACLPTQFDTVIVWVKDSDMILGAVWTWKVRSSYSLFWFKPQLNVNFRSLHWTSSMYFFFAPSCNWPLVPGSGRCFFTQTLCLHWVVHHIFSSSEGCECQVIQGFALDGSGRALCEHHSCFPHSLQHPALPKIWSASTCLMVIEQCPWKGCEKATSFYVNSFSDRFPYSHIS